MAKRGVAHSGDLLRRGLTAKVQTSVAFALWKGGNGLRGSEASRMARGLVPSRPFPTHLRRPILFRLAGKAWGEKGRLVTVWCVLRVQFRQAPMLKSLRTHIVTLQTLLYAPPVTELRICEQLPLNGCDKSALHSKFVKQYGFAGAPQSLPLPRSAR